MAVCNFNLTADLVKFSKITQFRSFWFLSLSSCPVLLNWDMAVSSSSSSSYNSAHNKLKYSPHLLTKFSMIYIRCVESQWPGVRKRILWSGRWRNHKLHHTIKKCKTQNKYHMQKNSAHNKKQYFGDIKHNYCLPVSLLDYGPWNPCCL